MSQLDSKSANPRGVVVQKPASNIYTVLLILALLALVVGCVLLYLEIQALGGFKGSQASAMGVSTPVWASDIREILTV